MSENKILAYKGFDADFKCRGYQFEVGATYKHDGEVKACSSGFHSCIDPLDVLSYYDITSRFAYVEIGGKTATHENDSKIASDELHVKAELKLPEFITDCINILKDECKADVSPGKQASSGNNSQQASSGDYSKQASSGYKSKQASSGDYSKQASSGYSSQQASSGDYSQQASSGDCSQQASSGNYSKQASSGNYSKQASSGNNSQQASSGDYSQQASSGYNSQQASSGNNSKLASSGYNSQQASSGNNSKQASSGNYSKQASSGNYSKHELNGISGVACLSGVNGKIKLGKNCAGSLTRWVDAERRYRISLAYEGENGIKPDTWYQLDDAGNFIECE